MGPRILTFLVVAALALFGVGTASIAASEERETVVSRDEDAGGVLATDDDGDGDDGDDDTDGNTGGGTDSFTSGVESRDNTNSRVTGVSMDTDRSRGDLTRDRTKDGPGTSTRDRSAHQTNDGSKHDTR